MKNMRSTRLKARANRRRAVVNMRIVHPSTVTKMRCILPPLHFTFPCRKLNHSTTPPPPPSLTYSTSPPSPLSLIKTILTNMRHLLSPITTMPISPSSSPSSPSPSSKPRKPSSSSSSNPNCNSPLCKHSASATVDIFFLILVLFSGTFLLTSYFSYIFESLSLLLPPLSLSSLLDSSLPYVLGFLFIFTVTSCSVKICRGYRSRKCEKPGCKGMKKELEFDLQLQTEECLKSSLDSKDAIDKLPWKGGTEGNPDYECLRSELRKMAPPNGRAVLLFRARCGCPVSKLEGWGRKRGRRNKK